MADKIFSLPFPGQTTAERFRGHQQNLVPFFEPIFVVVGLEIVQINVEHGKCGIFGQQTPQMLLDHQVAWQTGERIRVVGAKHLQLRDVVQQAHDRNHTDILPILNHDDQIVQRRFIAAHRDF